MLRKIDLVLYEKLYSRLYKRSLVVKVVLFIVFFSAIFWFLRINQGLQEKQLEQNLRSVPYLFGAGNLIFSVISGFIISIQWTKWDRLNDVIQGEINMLKQLFILAHHFPKEEMNDIRYSIYRYTKTYIKVSEHGDPKHPEVRSQAIDNALIKIEDSVFSASKKYSDIGPLVFGYLTHAMEYREKKIQISNQQLPQGIRIFVVFSTFSVIFGSFFIPFSSIVYNYYFSLVVALLAFGILLIIEDFNHPYRPGNFFISVNLYKVLMEEIEAKLKQRGFDIEKAEANETPATV